MPAFRRSASARVFPGSLACLLLGGLLAGCGAASEPAPAGTRQPLAFTETTAEAGLGAFRHENGEEGKLLYPEMMGAGGGFVDYDGDGWEDVALVGGGRLTPTGPADTRALRVFHNNQNGTFTEVTDAVGLRDARAYGTGITAADYDNDGDQDIFLAALGENQLYRNDRGTFTEVGRQAGVAGPGLWASSPLFFDADRDGHLDLLVPSYAKWTIATDIKCHRAGGRPDYCPPSTYKGDRSFYYHNNGDGTFTEQTEQAGFGTSPGKSLALAEWDFNADGWSDVVIVNDGEPNLLYLNNGDGTFTDQAVRSGIAYGEHGEARAGMGVDVGIVDSTGQPTIVVGNFSSEMIGVYRRTDSGWFADRAAASHIGGTSRMTLAFGVLMFDAELDSDLDLYVANGHVYMDPIDGADYRQKPHLFINDGNGTFNDMADSIGGPFSVRMLARAVAKADYDRDGDVDLLVTENNGPVHLLRNDSHRGNGLRVRLTGRGANLDALGAQVTAVATGIRMPLRVRAGSGYLSQSEKVLTFGLGQATRVDTLIVRWPDGQEERHTGLEAGLEVHLVQGQGIVSKTPPPAAPRVAQANP